MKDLKQLSQLAGSVAAEAFDAFVTGMPEDERLIVCGSRGDPTAADATRMWRPRPYGGTHSTLTLHPECNAYVCVSSFRQAEDGSWRRRREGFAAARALMVDDVGTKVPWLTVEALAPTAVIETSPGNHQVWYFLSEPCTDIERFGSVVEAFIVAKLLGADPGMGGFNRVGRLPGFVNGKPAYGGAYPVTMRDWHPDRRYTLDEIISAFGLELRTRRREGRALIDTPVEELRARVDLFKAHAAALSRLGMLKRHAPDAGGWIDVTCPWIDDHTGRADNGSSIRVPDADNGYYGAFRCHHGHCAGKGWRALTDWLAERVVEELDATNGSAQCL
jgi:hypothetical protein